jgi:hypothetical protein
MIFFTKIFTTHAHAFNVSVWRAPACLQPAAAAAQSHLAFADKISSKEIKRKWKNSLTHFTQKFIHNSSELFTSFSHFPHLR